MNRSSSPPGRAAPGSLRVLVVCDRPTYGKAMHDALRDGLVRAGCEVLGVLPAGLGVLDVVVNEQPDLIIIESASDWRDALEHVCQATRDAPRPIVLFTDDPDTSGAARAIAAGVSGYVVAGLSPGRVRPVLEVAMARFAIERSLREELDRTRDRLAGRQAVERAKGLLMDRLGLSEDEAFARLRRLAMDRKESLARAAERVIEAARLLG